MARNAIKWLLVIQNVGMCMKQEQIQFMEVKTK